MKYIVESLVRFIYSNVYIEITKTHVYTIMVEIKLYSNFSILITPKLTQRKEKYNRIKNIKAKAKKELARKIHEDLSQKRKIKEEKKRILQVNRKVKEQLKHFQHKMSKRTALMKKLIKIKHQIDKTTPFNVATKKINKNEIDEDQIIDHFIESNQAIKNMAKRLKKMRKAGHGRKGSHYSKRELKGNINQLISPCRDNRRLFHERKQH